MPFGRDGKPYKPQAGPCAWCSDPRILEPTDHVFPRSLGATRELLVPACEACDEKIEKLERRVARRSVLGLRRIQAGPRPRNPQDPSSGSFDPLYSLAPHPDGGFTDVRFKGPGPPVTLPSFQFEAKTGMGHFRYQSDPDREVAELVAALKRVDENLRSDPSARVELRLMDPDDPVTQNPTFLPRVSLGLNGRLFVTARSEEEATPLMQVAFHMAKIFPTLKREPPTTWTVSGGDPHWVGIVTHEDDDLRIASKVALGIAACRFGPDALAGKMFDEIRVFLTDGVVIGSKRARRVLPGKELRGWPDHHVAVVEGRHGFVRGLVVLSGLCY